MIINALNCSTLVLFHFVLQGIILFIHFFTVPSAKGLNQNAAIFCFFLLFFFFVFAFQFHATQMQRSQLSIITEPKLLTCRWAAGWLPERGVACTTKAEPLLLQPNIAQNPI